MNGDLNHDDLIVELQGEKAPVARALCLLLLEQKEMKEAICGNKAYKIEGMGERLKNVEKGHTYLLISTIVSLGLGAAASKSLLLAAVKLILP